MIKKVFIGTMLAATLAIGTGSLFAQVAGNSKNGNPGRAHRICTHCGMDRHCNHEQCMDNERQSRHYMGNSWNGRMNDYRNEAGQGVRPGYCCR